MPRLQDAIPSLTLPSLKERSNPLLLTPLRFAPESRLVVEEPPGRAGTNGFEQVDRVYNANRATRPVSSVSASAPKKKLSSPEAAA